MAGTDPRGEYLDVSANLRHWSMLRFAQLALYVALAIGVLSILYGRPAKTPLIAAAVMKLAAILATAFFMDLQERTMVWWYAFLARARELEKELGYEQYARLRPPTFFSGRLSMVLFYGVMFLFWTVLLLWG